MLRRAGGALESDGGDGAGSGAADDGFGADSREIELVSGTSPEGPTAPTAWSLSSGGLEGTLGSAEGTLDSASTVGKPGGALARLGDTLGKLGGVLARLGDTLGKPGGVGTLDRRGGTLGRLGGVGTLDRRGGALGRLGGTLDRFCSGMTEIRDGRGLSATVSGTASVFSSGSESHPESMSSVEGGNDSIDDGAGVDVAALRPRG